MDQNKLEMRDKGTNTEIGVHEFDVISMEDQ